MESKSKKLRSGYTTGACAAAAAKAAGNAVLAELKTDQSNPSKYPFPTGAGSPSTFTIRDSGCRTKAAFASIIKDAGDDPDVTHGAEIVATVRNAECTGIIIKGGKGVGKVTKPGLAIPVGEAAINPVPRKMIEQAVREAVVEGGNRTFARSRSYHLRSCRRRPREENVEQPAGHSWRDLDPRHHRHRSSGIDRSIHREHYGRDGRGKGDGPTAWSSCPRAERPRRHISENTALPRKPTS